MSRVDVLAVLTQTGRWMLLEEWSHAPGGVLAGEDVDKEPVAFAPGEWRRARTITLDELEELAARGALGKRDEEHALALLEEP